MATWPDVADTAVKIGIPVIGTALISASVAVFAYINSRAGERRNRRLAVLEEIFMDLNDWHDRWHGVVAAKSVKPTSDEAFAWSTWHDGCNSAIDKLSEGPNLTRVASRAKFFGFSGVSDAIDAVFAEHSRVWLLLGTRPLAKETAKSVLQDVARKFFEAEWTIKQAHRSVERSGWREAMADWLGSF